VTWQLVTADATTTVTRPEWPNMTAADRAAADRFVNALKAHEEGHHQVVRDVMGASPRTIRARGATADEAVSNLDAEMQSQSRRAQQRIDERNAAYDNRTDHGRNQAAVGGSNTTLTCP
jgi:predicted secreted Zn-dependent protease